MRTRKDIQEANDRTLVYASSHYDNNQLLLEVLLDMRELLSPPKKYHEFGDVSKFDIPPEEETPK